METAYSELVKETQVKPQEKMSYEDFLAWCDEDTLAGWVDGEIIMLSPASKFK